MTSVAVASLKPTQSSHCLLNSCAAFLDANRHLSRNSVLRNEYIISDRKVQPPTVVSRSHRTPSNTTPICVSAGHEMMALLPPKLRFGPMGTHAKPNASTNSRLCAFSPIVQRTSLAPPRSTGFFPEFNHNDVHCVTLKNMEKQGDAMTSLPTSSQQAEHQQ